MRPLSRIFGQRRRRLFRTACSAVAPVALLPFASAQTQSNNNAITVSSLTIAGGESAPAAGSANKLIFDAGESDAFLAVASGSSSEAFIDVQVRLESDLIITNDLAGYTLTLRDVVQGGTENDQHNVSVFGAGNVAFAQNIANVDAFTFGATGTLTFGGTTTLGSLTLMGGLIELSTAHLTVGTLTITGDTILDFGAHGESFLSANEIEVAEGATLTIRQWTDAADYFYVTRSPDASALAAIAFAGFESGAAWTGYDSQLRPTQPVPEPATSGVLVVGAAVSIFWLRRRRK